MRALLVASEFPPGPGGIGTHAAQLAAGLQSLGWGMAVLASQDYASSSEIMAFNGSQEYEVAHLRRVPGPPIEALYRSVVLRRRIRSHRPDLIIASGSRAVMLVSVNAGRDIPWVAIGHGTEFGMASGWQARVVGAAFRRASAVVCVSEYTRQQMHAAGIRPRAERVIPNGADPSVFRILSSSEVSGVRAELRLPPGRMLVTVGNVTERKGQDVVVRALPEIQREIPDVRYAIVGLPTRGDEIRRLAAELGVSDRVHLLGRLASRDVVRLLNECDLFVMTSRRTEAGDFEGYGIAAVEAALCAKACIVSSDSGLQEAVRDGETGVTVPQNDSGSVARAIVRLLGDDSARRRLGAAAQRRALKEQTWESRVADYDLFFRDVINCRGTAVSSGSPGRSA